MVTTYLIYTGVGILGLFLGFLAGFFTGSYRSAGSDFKHIEKALGFLEKDTEKALNAAAALLKQAKLRRHNKTDSELPTVVIGEQAEEPNPLVVRMRKTRHNINIIKFDIEAVTLSKNLASKGAPGGPESAFTRAKLEPQVDPIVVDLFAFDHAGDAERPTYPDAPQIRRSREADENADLSLSPSALGPAKLTSARDIVELYNLAVSDSLARERFREQVDPLRVGTINAVERRQNPTIEAEFRQTTDGDLFAFPISQDNRYAVVPRLGLTIEAVSYSAGALGEVFNKTIGHDPQRFYSRYRVRIPAIFKCEGDRWHLVEPGKLDLGPGD